jgi:two-component system, NtrC family, sensor kinase
MRLTWKLSFAVSLGILVVLAAHAAFRVRRDLDRFSAEARSNHRTMARALAFAVQRAAPQDDESPLALVREVDEADAELELALRPGRDGDDASFASVERTEPDGDHVLVSHLGLSVAGRPMVIEIEQRLTGRPERVREAVLRTASTTAVMLVACVSIILGFGLMFVARPLAALAQHARRFGRGELNVRTSIRGSDEIAELAREMNEMSHAVEQATARARREAASRVEALAQLRQADRLSAVGMMASSVAHDLGTPMASTRARAQMIADHEVDPERASALAVEIVDEIDRMSATIRRLLDHGRREDPQRVVTELRAWASEVLELLRPLADRRGVSMELAIDAEASAEIDPERMRHVLVNLVSNAIDASPAGGIVRVAVRVESGTVEITVDDEGKGASDAVLAQMFEPFFTTKRAGEGTGLGLSIVRGILEELGGEVRACSLAPVGMRFVVRAPRQATA